MENKIDEQTAPVIKAQEVMMDEMDIAEFDVSMLVNIVIGLAIAGLVSVFTLQLLGETRDDLTVDTDEYNASLDAIRGVAKVPAKLPLIATALVFLLIIAVIIRIAVIGKQV